MRYYKSKDYYRYSDQAPDNCVWETIKQIIEAQDKVSNNRNFTACDYSVYQLPSHCSGNQFDPLYTTIPFILYCKESCEPFIGSGVFQAPIGGRKRGEFFGGVETPVFRVNRFIKGTNHCVELELLLPVTDHYEFPKSTIDTYSTVCPFFSADDPVIDFFATNICLNVDLSRFFAITCLNPITPIPANQFQPGP